MIYSLLITTIITTLSTLIHALPPVFNLAPPHSNTTTHPLAVDTFCYSNSQYTKPIVADECDAALRVLRRAPNAYDDRFWSVPLAERRFLGRWSNKYCSIEVVGWTSTAEDWFSTNDVAVRAEEIIQKCVARKWHLGGRVEVGVKKMFQVVVIRKDEIPEVNAIA